MTVPSGRVAIPAREPVAEFAAIGVTAFTTTHVIKNVVHDFMCNDKLDLLSCHFAEELTIKINRASICCRSFNVCAAFFDF